MASATGAAKATRVLVAIGLGAVVVVALVRIAPQRRALAGSCRNYLDAADLGPARAFRDPLPIPNRLQPEYTRPDRTPVWVLHAREYTWRPAPGVCIPRWGFEDTTPGPTLVVQPHHPSEVVFYNELPGRLYNPYLDPFNQLSWTNPVVPIATTYTNFGPKPNRPPAPYDAAPYARSQYELDPQLTIHLHGGHQTPENDGYPMDTFGPGHSHVYDYPNNQFPTTLWYHDHAMDHTRGHVLMGLAGFYLIESPKDDARLGLPTGAGCERRPEYTNTPARPPHYWPTPTPSTPPPGRPAACDDIPVLFQRVPAEMLDQPQTPTRPIWTVNGTLAPSLTVSNKPYRFRFLNGNDESPLQIWTTTSRDDPTKMAPDAYLQQVGTDGGLMNFVAVDKDPAQTKIHLFPAQRADVVIDFSKIHERTVVYLQTRTLRAFVGQVPRKCLYQRCPFGDTTSQTPQPLIRFVVAPTIANPPSFAPRGGALRHGHGRGLYNVIEKLPTTQNGVPVRERTFVFGFNGHVGHNPFATVNGRLFDDRHIYARPVLGSIEIWHLINTTDGYHPVHIHDIEFQVISRSRCARLVYPDRPRGACTGGGRPRPLEPGDWTSCSPGAARCNLAWKDVFVVPPYSEVTIIGKFTDNTGLYVFHCHNLIHEDAGMMAQFEVVKARA